MAGLKLPELLLHETDFLSLWVRRQLNAKQYLKDLLGICDDESLSTRKYGLQSRMNKSPAGHQNPPPCNRTYCFIVLNGLSIWHGFSDITHIKSQ